MTCRIPWCNELCFPRPANNSKPGPWPDLCKEHMRLVDIASKIGLVGNWRTRPWLIYKLEHIDNHGFKCEYEDCQVNFDAEAALGRLTEQVGKIEAIKILSSLFHVDHKDSNLKTSLEEAKEEKWSVGEHPRNYEFMHGMCHQIKTMLEGDCVAKPNRS